MAEEASPDTASWVEIKVTAIFTAATTAVFVVVFEVCRRHPALSEVFDRRRSTKPNRTPPPLLRGRLFEWLFLSTDPGYLEYSYIRHKRDIVTERKRQHSRYLTRKKSSINNMAPIKEEEPPPAKKVGRKVQFTDSIEEIPNEVEPPENNESSAGDVETNRRKVQDQHESSSTLNSSFTESTLSTTRSDDQISIEIVATPRPKSSRRKKQTSQLTPDVVEINGRRLPASIAAYAISGDLSEAQLNRYERELFEREKAEEEELLAQERDFESRKQAQMSSNASSSGHGRILSRVFSSRNSMQFDSDEESQKRGSSRSIMSGRSTSSSTRSLKPDMEAVPLSLHRHLNAAAVIDKRPLSLADEEMLRCVGLDAFVMIRFLRFGFDCTFYPFVAACLVLIPTYYTNAYEGVIGNDEVDDIVTNGYFQITMNRLEPGSVRLWVATSFNFVFFCYVLRRLWIEWETFIALRFDFLANGDVEPDSIEGNTNKKNIRGSKIDPALQQQQYRNSCLVEYIPESHRRDKELFEFFNALFPGEVKRAEILLNSAELDTLIAERQRYIERYENIYARHAYAKQKYRSKIQDETQEDVGVIHYICCRCFGKSPRKPEEPKMKVDGFCCGRKKVKALPYLLSEIKRLNRIVTQEHQRILKERSKIEDKEYSQGFLRGTLGQGKKFLIGAGSDLNCETGFVEFANLSAAQVAVQCNLTGTDEFMVTTAAPDPRDIHWYNATVDRATIKWKKLQCDALLFTGTLFWSGVVTFIVSVSQLEKLEPILPGWMIPKEDTFWYGLLQGYLPVIMLEALMWFIPPILRFVGFNYVRFKSKSEVDKFVFIWHFAYRVTNLLIIIVSGSLYETLDAILVSPTAFVNTLASGIAQQSQFFLNNMIVAAGTETLWELAQMPQMIMHFVIFKIINVEAKSRRALEKLQEPESFEWGEVVPPFIFSFLVGCVYCTMVPLVIGVCAVFFYVSIKVYTHQALFVYAQPYEGGGKLMVLLNRSVFVMLYISIAIFSTVMGLREAAGQAPAFFFVTSIITVLVDYNISRTFVAPSATLALSNARMVDEENKKQAEKVQKYQEYKRAKLEKLKASRVRAKEDAADQRQKKLDSAPDNSESGTRIRFHVNKEVSPEQIRQRESDKEASMSDGATQFGLSGSGISRTKDQDGKDDFYLYRQPSLNKSLWETKPQPYR